MSKVKQVNVSDYIGCLSPRKQDAHKGQMGHVLVIGGAPGFSGAARMAAEASARVGAGLVSIATHPSHSTLLNIGRPELMSHAVEHCGDIQALLEISTVVALGPGLGHSSWAQDLFDCLHICEKPKVIDADALHLLAKSPKQHDNWVLTPHPGEAADLLGISVKDVQNDREGAVVSLQKKYGGVALLKGSGTLICDGGAELHICQEGNPGMASGGMGDVLTGVIAGLMAQGTPTPIAARLGVGLHACAGDAAAKNLGERGLLASDLFDELHVLVNP